MSNTKYQCDYCGNQIVIGLSWGQHMFCCPSCKQAFKKLAYAQSYGVNVSWSNNTMNEASFVYDGNTDTYQLTMGMNWKNPNHKAFIDYIKIIPASDRLYDPKMKVWTIDPKHYQYIVLPLQQFFNPVYIFTKEQYEEQQREWAHAANPPIPVDQYKATVITILRRIGVLPDNESLPSEFNVANKLYRRACMYLHPDRNSDPQAATEIAKLNEAWAIVKKEQYKIGEVVNG